MHGMLTDWEPPPPRPNPPPLQIPAVVIAFATLGALGFFVYALGSRYIPPLTPERPWAVVPGPARLRHRNERLA